MIKNKYKLPKLINEKVITRLAYIDASAINPFVKKNIFHRGKCIFIFYLSRVITVVELLLHRIGAIFKLKSLSDWTLLTATLLAFFILSPGPITTLTF